MEEHVLQAVGKVAGIGGLAFGVFLLLFREVIRKNIFPKLSDHAAYRLIRQFMYLTFGLAIFGISAWMYLTITTGVDYGGAHHARRSEKPPEPSPDISGEWIADVKYSWGDLYHEKFSFQLNNHEVSGAASYVTASHPILEGKIDGNRLDFQTVSYTEVNGQRYQEKHRYRGVVSGDKIEYVLTTESGYDSPPPLNFTSHKKPTP